MAELIKLEEVVVDEEAEILQFATEMHDRLCVSKNGCTRTDADELAPYIERVTELYNEGEFF